MIAGDDLFDHVEVVLFDLAPHAEDDLAGLEDEYVVASLRKNIQDLASYRTFGKVFIKSKMSLLTNLLFGTY